MARGDTSPVATGRSAEIDAFLATLPEDSRNALEDLRRAIAAAAPGAVETISYGVPAFKLDGRPLVSFGAAKQHCSFYVQSPAVMADHRDELTAFETTKGTIHFTPDLPPGEALVARLVRARIAEQSARGT